MVPAKVESDASLSCDAPGSDNDANASVQVTHNGQDFLLTGFLFRFRARPRLFSLAPSFGSDLGGKVVHCENACLQQQFRFSSLVFKLL